MPIKKIETQNYEADPLNDENENSDHDENIDFGLDDDDLDLGESKLPTASISVSFTLYTKNLNFSGNSKIPSFQILWVLQIRGSSFL